MRAGFALKIPDAVAILLSVLIGISGVLWSVSVPPAAAVRILTPFGEYRYSLQNNRTVTVRGDLGDYTLEIRNGQVKAVDSACPEKICLHRGWIVRRGDSIICVPNRIIVRLEDSPGDVDAVSE